MIEKHYQAQAMQYAEELRLQTCLEALSKRYNISELILDQEGNAGLELVCGERIYLHYNNEVETLYIYTPFAPLPFVNDGEMMLEMLRLNCLEKGTYGGVISISDSFGAFIYHVGIKLKDLESEYLEDTIQIFVERSKGLRQTFN